jgi:putative endonuclease
VSDQKKKTYDRGIVAEGAAELFLRAKGFDILARRYKTPVGEIDIIARDDAYLVFVEVKARPSIDEALISITPKMRERIHAAAGHFISSFPQYAGFPMRVDVMAVKLPFTIRHLENAFME